MDNKAEIWKGNNCFFELRTNLGDGVIWSRPCNEIELRHGVGNSISDHPYTAALTEPAARVDVGALEAIKAADKKLGETMIDNAKFRVATMHYVLSALSTAPAGEGESDA